MPVIYLFYSSFVRLPVTLHTQVYSSDISEPSAGTNGSILSETSQSRHQIYVPVCL